MRRLGGSKVQWLEQFAVSEASAEDTPSAESLDRNASRTDEEPLPQVPCQIGPVKVGHCVIQCKDSFSYESHYAYLKHGRHVNV